MEDELKNLVENYIIKQSERLEEAWDKENGAEEESTIKERDDALSEIQAMISEGYLDINSFDDMSTKIDEYHNAERELRKLDKARHLPRRSALKLFALNRKKGLEE